MVLLLLAAGPALAQSGRVMGVISQESTGQPLEGVLVRLEGTPHQSVTQANGRYLIPSIPAGTYTVLIQFIGHATFQRDITVAAGEVVVVNASLAQEAIAMQEIVVTGVIGATPKSKIPFAIDQVSAASMPVPALNAASSIQGKVAGAMVVQGSGRPGSAPSILLRGATSIDAAGRSQEPLYIVDGTILGQSVVDIDGLDVESVEVIKGAAAASLFGSRAANGVIQITTKRGRSISTDAVQYTVKSEYGRSSLAGEFWLTKSHHYLLGSDGNFLSRQSKSCNFLSCPDVGGVQLAGQKADGRPANAWNSYQSEPWPGGARNQVSEFFDGGVFQQHYLGASGRSGATNFHISAALARDGGVMPGQDGLERDNYRVNIDQAIAEKVTVSASAFYSRSKSDLFPETQGNPLFDLTRMPAGVDLTACVDDPTKSCRSDPQNMILLPDPTNKESPNPLYDMLVREFKEERNRFLGSVNTRFSPLTWLDFDANLSYDRAEQKASEYRPKGYRTINPSPTNNNGNMDQDNLFDEALNASVTASMRFALGEHITNRTQVRYLYEQAERKSNYTYGSIFSVRDVPVFDNLDPRRLSAESFQSSIRSDGYFAITNFDIKDRYILDGLLRNDGSSLFGASERRHFYYRLAGAWRISQEEWASIPGVDELKVRYALGTAGGRPRFEAQYETFSVSGGQVVPLNLGNKLLKPEFTQEHEVGVDALLFDGRIGMTVNYANTTTNDQIIRVPLPNYTGYNVQWRNAGTMVSNTWEASVDARLIQTQNLTWSTRLLFDRTRSEITELPNVPDFTYGVAGQNLGNVFYARPGEKIGTFYGLQFATKCEHLPAGADCSQFQVNDEGYLVWVGAGGNLSENKWGTSSGLNINGRPVMWGAPFAGECKDRSSGESTFYCQVGKTMPDFHFGASSTLTWKGISLYGMLDGVQGFDVYNQPLQWAVFKRYAGIMDQKGRPAEKAKPLGYYDELYGVSGLRPSSAFVEDGSFIKLREVSLRYRIDPSSFGNVFGLRSLDGVSLMLQGRNLHTWTKYRGYDPEVGKSGGDTGSAALARVEGYQYPNFRTWTFGVEINF